jgi:hypothetical protein
MEICGYSNFLLSTVPLTSLVPQGNLSEEGPKEMMGEVNSHDSSLLANPASQAGLAFPESKPHTDASVSPPSQFFRRLGWLAAFLAIEWVPISAWVANGKWAHTGYEGQAAARFLAAFVFLLFTFGYFKVRAELPAICRQLAGTRVSWGFLCAQLVFTVRLALSRLGAFDGDGGRQRLQVATAAVR